MAYGSIVWAKAEAEIKHVDANCRFSQKVYHSILMKPFLLRFEERPKTIGNGQVMVGDPASTQAALSQSAQTGTKTLTEVKRESGDKDPGACSCRAFQFENV